MSARFARNLLVALALAASACAGPQKAEPPPRAAYDLALADAATGERYDFARLSGKVSIVYFFSTWCLPCLQELKVLTTLEHQYQEQGLSVVAVGLDLEGPKVLRPFAQATALPFPVLVANDEVRSGRSPYGPIRAVPTTFLLDRKGRPAGAWAGPADPLDLQRAVGRLVR